jgi:phage-related protein
LGKLADTINTIKDNMNWLIPVASGLLGTFMAFQAITTVTSLMDAWKKSTIALKFAQGGLNAVMAANPIAMWALAIGAVIALGVLLWKNWDTIKVKALELWVGIKAAFAPVATFFASIWDSVKAGFKGLINYVIDGINNWIKLILLTFNLLVKAANLIPGVNIPELKFEIPKLPQFALGTQYFKGGPANINERGGEIVNLPNGSKVIPADKSKNMLGKGINVQVIIQGNLIGNEEYADYMGNHVANKVLTALANM